MNKHDVIKALALCNDEGVNNGVCADCPYVGMTECYKCLATDTIALLKSEPWYNDKPIYHTAIIYTKHTNLLPWLDGQYNIPKNSRVREHYSRNREVQLILLVRHEVSQDARGGEANKCICRIKCPINPLPIRGEFECISTSEMTKLLASMGWKYKEKIHYNLFK